MVEQSGSCFVVLYTLCLKINLTPETFYYNFAKIVLI